MALRCVTCGAENPATNRFCGQCGTQLARATGDPEEFCRQTRTEPSGRVEASRVPAGAFKSDYRNPGDTADNRLRHAVGWIDQVHDHVEREAGMRDQLQDRSETDLDVSTKEMRCKANAAAANAGSGNANNTAPANSGATQPLNKYRIVIERENTARTGFLGLSDAGTPGYDDEEREPPSHLWRNLAVAVVAVAVALTAWQWRSIRDYGRGRYSLASVLNGLREAAPGNAGVPTPSAVAAESASRSVGLPATTGVPPEVESSSGADHTRPVQQTGSSLGAASGAATSNPSTDAISPRAMGAPVADVPESQSPNQPEPANPPPSRTADPGNLPRTALPGAYEMNRAAHAGDAEVRAMWLWKAVGTGNPQARVELARMYVQGSGVARNCDQARVLLRGNEQAKPSLQQVLLQGGCSTR